MNCKHLIDNVNQEGGGELLSQRLSPKRRPDEF